MPRFFSKSLGDASAADVLKTTKEETSEDSEPSPSPRPAALAAIKKETTRTASPLDIFFKADREEKARAASTGTNTPDGVMGQSRSQTGSPAFQGSPSPAPARLNRSGNHPAGNQSPGEMFALEMDGTGMRNDPRSPAHQAQRVERRSSARAQTAPARAGTNENDDDEARRQAKTQALKDLLWSPQASRPASSAANFGPALHATGSLPSSPPPHAQGNNGRTSYHRAQGSNPSVMKYDNFKAPLPSNGKSPHHSDARFASTSGSPRPPTRSSQLRQEMTPTRPNLASAPRHPSSPLPTGKSSLDIAAASHNNLQAHLNNSGQSFSPQPTPPPHATPPPASKPSVEHMEADLRRMLNLGPGVPFSGLNTPPKGNGTPHPR